MQNKEEYLKFIKDLQIVNNWIGNNEELDIESRTIIITWLLKMANQLEDNLNALIKIKEENETRENTLEES